MKKVLLESAVAIACAYISVGITDSETLIRKSTTLAQMLADEVLGDEAAPSEVEPAVASPH